MSRSEFQMLVELALIVREIAPPDYQRRIDRAFEVMQSEHDAEQASTPSIQHQAEAGKGES